MTNTLNKVTAFITRQTASGMQILLIRHPFAGNQFPAGTVEPDEDFEATVLREVGEETGLKQAVILNQLGELIEQYPGRAFTLRSETVYARPDDTSFDWARLPRGVGVDLLRERADFTQVSFVEDDKCPDPSYVSYQITGWVRKDCLATQLRRRFYHLTSAEETPDTWQRYIDQHTFNLFWADVHAMPEIIAPQSRYWTKFCNRIIGN